MSVKDIPVCTSCLEPRSRIVGLVVEVVKQGGFATTRDWNLCAVCLGMSTDVSGYRNAANGDRYRIDGKLS